MYQGGTGIANVHIAHRSLQSANTPDIDLDRDVIGSEAEVLLGMETAELETQNGLLEKESTDTRFRVNLSTIMISALLFLAVLAWFDFIQATFYNILEPQSYNDITASTKLWYAIFVTIIIFILVVLIYYHAYNYLK